MKVFFEILKNAIGMIKMKRVERQLLRARLSSYRREGDIGTSNGVRSPYVRSVVRWSKMAVKVSALLLIFAISGGASVVAAASDALPGDYIYPV